MNLANPFSQQTKQLFFDVHECWICGKNENYGKEAHHIYGRVSNSPCNLAILCTDCHKGMCHNDREHQMLLGLTLVYLAWIGYVFTPRDTAFLSTIKRDFMIVATSLL